MTTLIESEIKAVKSDGIVWMIKGTTLYMTDEEGTDIIKFRPGSETYRYKLNQLSKLKPLPESERLAILSKLKKNIDELI